VTLEDWARNGWLTPHEPSAQEIRDLLAVSDRDLHDCLARGLSADWRLNIAYNAALQLATAALAASGYRASREAHHYRVIQSLAYTVQADRRVVAQLDQLRRKRNVAGYERAGSVSDREAREMAELARQLRETVSDWLAADHPELL
jgi:hypothetical protein